jgi:4-hydroxymandelate synthase
MKIQGIDHIEFYVDDLRGRTFHLCRALGFRACGRGGPDTGLPGQSSLLLRQGQAQIVLTAALEPGHPAAGYVRRHGDGVATVALRTDNVRAAFADAVAGGALPLAGPACSPADGGEVATASVAAFGDVTHTLVERTGLAAAPGPAGGLPPGMVMTTPGGRGPAGPEPAGPEPPGPELAGPELAGPEPPGPEPPGGAMVAGPEPPGGAMVAVDHIAVCLPAGDLARTVRLYQEAFGLDEIFDERIEVGGQAMLSKVVQDSSREVTFTLIEPDLGRDPGQIDEFLAAHGGAGVQHVALRTGDIAAAVRVLTGRGVEFLTAPSGYYRSLEDRLGALAIPPARLRELNILADSDRWGQMFQIFARSTHERRTFFVELIERRGALTFGTGNIRALYEALDRRRGMRDGDA